MSDAEGTQTPTETTTPPSEPPSTKTDTAPVSGGKESQDPAWLPERLERARKSALTEMLREVGAPSVDDLKAAMREYRALKNQQALEAETWQKSLTEAQKRAEAAEQALQQMQAQVQQERIEAAIRAAAGEAQARYPDDIVVWARASGENLETLLDKAGKPDTEKIKKLVEKAREARPEWFKGYGPGSPSNANARNVEWTDATRAQGRAGMQTFVRNNW